MAKTLNKAVIVGASGLIGSHLLDILLQQAEYEEVLALVRSELPVSNPKLVQLIVNFDEPGSWENAITGRVIFCCLGTTLKKTPDKLVYRKIDHDYPVLLAQLAAKNGVKQYHFVSSIGASSKAGSFYPKLKGETEDDIQKVKLPTLHIYRPSLLTGDRKEHRAGEGILVAVMKMIDPLLIGGLKKYRSIPAATVAMAMFKQSIQNKEGVFIHSSDKIKLLA